jgi:outer membrane receptor for ferrienterochelin and colicins
MGTAPGQAESIGSLAARTDASGKVRWAPDSGLAIEASVLALDERQRWRTGTFFNFSDNVQWSASLGGVWRRGRHRFAPTIFASIYDHLSRASTEPKPIAGDTGQRQIQRLYQAELLYNAPIGESGAHALDLGVQLRHDETEAGRVDGGLRSLNSIEPFVQLEIAPTARLSLVPGVRVSHNTEWGTHVTPRLAARFRASERLTLRASAGSGYRAPDFKELYMFFQNVAVGYAVVGNVDLHPETSRNVTAGVEWGGERGYARGQLFWNGFRDFIETRAITAPDEPPVFQYQNVDDGSTRGADVEGQVSVRGVRLEGGYSALATRNDATGRPLLGRPTHSARSTVSYAFPFGTRTSVATAFTGRTPMQRDR